MAAAVVSVIVVAVEGAIAGKRLPANRNGALRPDLPNLLLDGITRHGPSFSRKLDDEMPQMGH